MDMTQTVNLLVVDICVAEVVVECPPYEADVGDLVEFAYDGRDIIGTVTKKIISWKDSEEYAFISTVITMYEAKRVWRKAWDVTNAEKH